MDPVSAIGLASSIVQLITFAGDLISKGCQIHSSADGALEENAELETITSSLQELINNIKVQSGSKTRGVTRTERQLKELCSGCEDVAQRLIDVVQSLRIKGSPNSRWGSFRQALLSVWKEKDIKQLSTRLERYRRQIDTVLLAILRERIERVDPTFTGLTEKVAHDVFHGSNVMPWQMVIVDELHKNNWKLKNEQDMEMFSASLTRLGDHTQQLRVAESLRFSDMGDRYEQITTAHQKTFEWMFDQPGQQDTAASANSGTSGPSNGIASKSQRQPQAYQSGDFVEWLRGDSNLFWITGKPGSGKSTLMKYIYNEARTLENLEHWKKDAELIMSGFFFWNSGTVMQMAREGLLRGILHHALMSSPADVPHLFPARWQRVKLFGADPHPWSWTKLKKAFENLISQSPDSKKFFLVIDGLDEFSGDCAELAAWIVKAAAKSNVKMCVASRPWLVFEDGFKYRSSLKVEELTVRDIQLYTLEKLCSHGVFLEIQRLHREEAAALVSEVTKRAAGVFLWVRLVVASLLDGLRDGDTIMDLKARLHMLPPELEQLFKGIMEGLEPLYRKQASRMIHLVQIIEEPFTLLSLSFTDRTIKHAMSAKIAQLEPAEKNFQLDRVRRHLSSRCKGLIEAPTYRRHGAQARVQFLHRTVRDFVTRPEIEMYIRGLEGNFDPHQAICASQLLRLKHLDKSMDENSIRKEIQSGFRVAVHSAEKITSKDSRLPISIATELGETIEKLLKSQDKADLSLGCTEKNDEVQGLEHLVWAIEQGLVFFVQSQVHRYRVEDVRLGAFYLNHAFRQFSGKVDFSPSDVQILRILLENGADPNRRTQNGKTAWESFKILLVTSIIREAHLEIIELFNKHGARPPLRIGGLSTDEIQQVLSRSDHPMEFWWHRIRTFLRKWGTSYRISRF